MNDKSTLLFTILMTFFCLSNLCAQDASEIDVILDSGEITFSRAADFVTRAAQISGDSAAELKSALFKDIQTDTPVRLGNLCFMIMKSFKLKGSFLYAIFPGPRYAYREMKYLGLVPEPCDPSMVVSGLQLLQIVERVLNYTSNEGEGSNP